VLARRLGATFLDADDLHDDGALADMAAGRPLDATRRAPWIERVRRRLVELAHRGPVVCACSALTASARDRLRSQDGPVRFVWLAAPPDLLAARLAQRRQHPVGPSLLPSQLATLERPRGDDVLALDATMTPPDLVDAVVCWLDGSGTPSHGPDRDDARLRP